MRDFHGTPRVGGKATCCVGGWSAVGVGFVGVVEDLDAAGSVVVAELLKRVRRLSSSIESCSMASRLALTTLVSPEKYRWRRPSHLPPSMARADKPCSGAASAIVRSPMTVTCSRRRDQNSGMDSCGLNSIFEKACRWLRRFSGRDGCRKLT